MSNQIEPMIVGNQREKQKFFRLTFNQLLTCLCAAAVPIAICVYTAIDSQQKMKEANKNRQFDLQQAEKLRQEHIFDQFIQDIYILDKDGQLNESAKPWVFANARYWSAHRQWNPDTKVDGLVFLKRRELIGRQCRTKNNQMNKLEDIIQLNELNFDHIILRSQTNGLVPLNMTCVRFNQVSLEGAVIHFVNLNGATFDGSRLNHVKFEDSSLVGAIFNGTTLYGTNFANSYLQDAQFIGVDLTMTKLTENQMQQADFKDSKLPNGTISGETITKITGAFTMITQEKKSNATYTTVQTSTTSNEKLSTFINTTESVIAKVNTTSKAFYIVSNASGVIRQDTIWIKANSPYLLTADVQVPRGFTLTIEAGVHIIYDNSGDFEILVKGFLHIKGTANEHVIFDGSMTTKNTKWMLTFQATNLSKSSIAYVDFIGPKQATGLFQVTGAPSVNTGELIYRYCTFVNTQINIGSTTSGHLKSYQTSATLIVQNSTITDSIIDNGRYDSQIIKLRSNQIQSVLIKAVAEYARINMDDCRGNDITIHWGGDYQSHFEITDTKLTNITVIQTSSPFFVSNYSFIIQRSILSNATIRFRHEDHTSATKVYIISSQFTIPQAIQMGTGLIESSSITSFGNNTNSTGIYAGSISIIDSSIFNFTNGLSTFQYTQPMGRITKSNFYKNSRYNIINLSYFDVNATGNWWGTTTNIGDTLYDYWDNIAYGEILYDNYALGHIGQMN